MINLWNKFDEFVHIKIFKQIMLFFTVKIFRPWRSWHGWHESYDDDGCKCRIISTFTQFSFHWKKSFSLHSSILALKKKFCSINGASIQCLVWLCRWLWLLLWQLFMKVSNTIENICFGKHTIAYNTEPSLFLIKQLLLAQVVKIQHECSK